jgi:hypothetical protein
MPGDQKIYDSKFIHWFRLISLFFISAFTVLLTVGLILMAKYLRDSGLR